MTWWEALVLGIVQGVTEFLPVSSSGHLVIAGVALGVDTPGVFFEVMVHVATLLSVVVVYRAAVASLLRRAATGDTEAWRYLGNLALASIPAAVVGVLLEDVIARAFDTPAFVGAMLLVTGALLWSTRWTLRDANCARVGWVAALWMGVAQAFAILPGISRSGATVAAALWRDVDADAAAQFSFLMSIPVILGAGMLEVSEIFGEEGRIDLLATGVAFVAAAVSGVLAIRLFVSMLQKRNFYAFAPYVWLVGFGFLAYGLL